MARYRYPWLPLALACSALVILPGCLVLKSIAVDSESGNVFVLAERLPMPRGRVFICENDAGYYDCYEIFDYRDVEGLVEKKGKADPKKQPRKKENSGFDLHELSRLED